MNGTRAKATALLTTLQLAVAGTLAAQGPDVRDLFPARPDGFVTDGAGVVDETSKARMTSLIERLRAATGAEIAVVTLPTIGDRSEADVALAIGRAWGVGARAEVGEARRNAGLVLLLVPLANHQPGTGRIRIEVGQGLEGIVTDAAAGRVREVMRPALVREEYGPALTTAVEALAGLIARSMGVSDTALTNAAPVAGGGEAPPLTGLLPLLLLIVVFLVMTRAFAGTRRRRRVYWAGPWIGGGGGGGWGGGGGGGWGGGGGFGGFGGGGGFSGGGAGGRF